ncbi:MAG: S-layer homology domain-containing protein [Clostridia bacterium]|nr:S-layer homology domain-containing protein [Clostridia bacterium]
MTKIKNISTFVALLTVVCTFGLLCTTLHCNVALAEGRFSDVVTSDWYYDDVVYVNENGLMNGTDSDLFAPENSTTRAMIVTILWRLDGEQKGGISTFSDVNQSAYYYDAVAWASSNQIVSGYSENLFGSDDPIKREQLATIMYRYAQYKNYDCSKTISLNGYADFERISSYAVSAFEWANAEGIITGSSQDTILPDGEALRCQVAAILRRFCEKYKNSSEVTETVNTVAAINNSGSSGGGGAVRPQATAVPTQLSTDKTAKITVGKAEAKAGDNVDIEVKIDNNPGVLGMALAVEYDMDNLTLENAINGEAFSNVLDFTSSKTLISGTRFLWDGIELNPQDIKNGTILTLRFHISDTAKEGKYPITVAYRAGDIVDNNLSNIDLNIENGGITVKN